MDLVQPWLYWFLSGLQFSQIRRLIVSILFVFFAIVTITIIPLHFLDDGRNGINMHKISDLYFIFAIGVALWAIISKVIF